MSLKDYLLFSVGDALLAYRTRPSAIRGALSRRAYSRAGAPSADSVVIGVVQMRLDLIDDGVAFALKYADLMQQAVERGAQLIVFPAYTWLSLLGLLPPARELAARGVTLSAAVEGFASDGGLTRQSIFRTMVSSVRRIFETTAAELARRFNVYLMPGTSITADRSGHLFDTAYLFGPDGRLIGTQLNLHKSRTDKQRDRLSVGSQVGVFELPFGKLAMPVSMDHTFWETARIATLRGADILLGSSAVEYGAKFRSALCGAASRIQESPAYSLHACCISQLFGLNISGPSSILAPVGVWDNESVFMAQTKTPDQEEVIVARLDIAFLRKWRATQPRDFNLGLYGKYLPLAYEMYRTRVIQDGRRKVT